MQFKDKESSLLFLKYAAPCASNPEEVSKAVNEGKVPEIDVEESFPTAANMLRVTSKQMDREEIDEEVIRNYFWRKHAEFLKENKVENSKLLECIVMPGKVTGEKKIKLLNGEIREVETSTALNTQKGSLVTMHRNHVCETISKEHYRALKDTLENLELVKI